MKPVGVLHLTDTLEAGGAERVAVNLANLLPRERYRSFLCSTRRDGILAQQVAPHVGRICLARQRTFDLGALQRLASFIQANDIRLLHAHSTALFVAVLVSCCPPYPRVIWHDHYGNHATKQRPAWLYRLLLWRVSGIIAVSQPLADWARKCLRVPDGRVKYIPNFVATPTPSGEGPALPGVAGKRLVCVANLRPQKDHLTLVQAMAAVVAKEPEAHLLLVGAFIDQAYFARVKKEIARLKLDRHISFLGEQLNAPAILLNCDIGVLSSASEGLPLSLLEYGMAGLPVIATDVGQCREVLNAGHAGLLVAPAAPAELAAALVSLLRSPAQRTGLGQALQQRVRMVYSPQAALTEICQTYDAALRPMQTQKSGARRAEHLG